MQSWSDFCAACTEWTQVERFLVQFVAAKLDKINYKAGYSAIDEPIHLLHQEDFNTSVFK